MRRTCVVFSDVVFECPFLSTPLWSCEFLNRNSGVCSIRERVSFRCRRQRGIHARYARAGNVENRPRDHFRNHHHNHVPRHSERHRRNALDLHEQRDCATWNVSQTSIACVILGAMRRQKREPKHVRDFFYQHALSVRVITLCLDGLWWLIVTGLGHSLSWPGRCLHLASPFLFFTNERQRRLHTFVAGRTGVGKSVLFHNLIRHYLVWNKTPSLVVLDPHGDLARSIVRDRANRRSGRLIYLNFDGIAGNHIHLNPFDLPRPTEQRLNRAQVQFAGAVEQIVGHAFTPVQRTLIRTCLAVMLHKPGLTLVDLVRLLQDDRNADLLRHGEQSLPNPVDRQFFASTFANSHYRATKQALVARLTDIVRDPYVRRFTCQPSSFDLGEALDSGKVLVACFNPSRQSPDTIRTIGQLLNAAILSHVLGRTPYKRQPIHLFVDECQYFVSPTITDILGESRKFGLYLTLATQRVERLDPNLQDAILGNVGTLWVGASRHTTAEKLARETDLKAEQIRTLPNLTFYQVAGDKPATRRRLRFIGRRYAMSPKAWARLTRQQARLYYRAPAAQPADTTSPESWAPYFL